jgi:formylmethanofuran dehydrogenase subunit E
MSALGATRSDDEELVAIVENDACGVDALQFLTGCTFGKGNLIFRDYGKQVYTLFSRKTGRGVRVVFHGNGIPDVLRKDRMARTDYILTAPDRDLISVSTATVEIPEPATVRESDVCSYCGERVMVSRIREIGGRCLCIPCSSSET